MNVHVSMCRCTGLPLQMNNLVEQERSLDGQFLIVTSHLAHPPRRHEVHELLRVRHEEKWLLDGSNLWGLKTIGSSNPNGSSQFPH